MSQSPASPDETSAEVILVETPPRRVWGIVLRLGPGLIVAGSIVGSGELIATTATGAKAGFWLLWLILIGCVIKVFVQVELGRYTLVGGRTTMEGMAEVPGPRIPGRGNWLVWYWFVMFLASTAQLGGIVGGVGQALTISAPLTAAGHAYNQYAEAETQLIVKAAELRLHEKRVSEAARPTDDRTTEQLRRDVFDLERSANRCLIPLKRAELDRTADGKEAARLQAEVADLTALRDRFAALNDPTAAQLVLISHFRPVAEAAEKLVAAAANLRTLPDNEAAANEVAKSQVNLDQVVAHVRASEPELDEPLLYAYRDARICSRPPAPLDDKLWASIITAITMVILVLGRYGLIQTFSTVMVATFTLVTVVNLVMLQSNATWGINLIDILRGMSFRLPPGDPGGGVATALKTFGIIGVGASELVTYPYWCLEKGYARFTGPKDDSPEWAERARGWMRVMRWDAWCSMVVYTFATIAFYLLGAAILGRTGLDPKGNEMIRYLAVMYEPVFGSVAQIMFLFGAFAVLYSTFFVANASNARVFSDALRVLRLAGNGPDAHRRRVRIFSGLFPFLCLLFFWTGWDPQQLVLFSGLMQAIMLPMLAAAALFFRYFRSDPRLTPGILWDILLWISAIGLLVSGSWAGWLSVASIFG